MDDQQDDGPMTQQIRVVIHCQKLVDWRPTETSGVQKKKEEEACTIPSCAFTLLLMHQGPPILISSSFLTHTTSGAHSFTVTSPRF